MLEKIMNDMAVCAGMGIALGAGFPQKLSIGALSQQFPFRLMLLMNPCSFASS